MACVMIVEDDVDIRRSIAEALELEGYEVVEAADGREALQKLRQNTRPAVIVLDLMMPGMNGWQFRDAQRNDPGLAGIPVIVASARARDGTIEADSYVAKPFSLETLFHAIASCASPSEAGRISSRRASSAMPPSPGASPRDRARPPPGRTRA